MRKKLLILIVAYNAEKTIKTLLDRIPKEVLDYAEEILIADDASKDSTFLLAEHYKKERGIKKIKIVKHTKNKGYGGNQKWGYQYAITHGFDIVVMVHGDAQYPPEYIMPLIKPIVERKADFVFGSRMAGHPLRGNMPFYKFLGNIFLTTVENMFLGTRLTEFHSGFRAYSVDALKSIPLKYDSDGFHFDSEIIFQLVEAKKKIKEITIPTFYGEERSNVKVIPYGLNVLKELLKYTLHRLGLRKYNKYAISG
ncbi:glycosyltransferase family 2 protein [Candidatus Pacearchaeota archaeon]|nr:glycosyltransferase family 2 protein [Candidatus Pacearchaeota archaeon]